MLLAAVCLTSSNGGLPESLPLMVPPAATACQPRTASTALSPDAVGMLDACLRAGWHLYFTWGLADLKASPHGLGFFCTCFCCRLCLLTGCLASVHASSSQLGEAVLIALLSPGSFWSPFLLVLSTSLRTPYWHYHNISLFHLWEAESFLISMLTGLIINLSFSLLCHRLFVFCFQAPSLINHYFLLDYANGINSVIFFHALAISFEWLSAERLT